MAAQRAYAANGRHYHNWSHIQACANWFAQLEFARPRPVLLALAFHDAVYIAGRKDNEQRSAELAAETLRQTSLLPKEEILYVSHLILATAKHQSLGTDNDLDQMLDIDMSILGAEPHDYKSYARGVEAEFCGNGTSKRYFRIGRTRFLNAVLHQDQIFLTDCFRKKLETRARSNIGTERSALLSEMSWLSKWLAKQ